MGFNLDAVPDMESNYLEIGTHTVRIIDFEIGNSKIKQTPFVKFKAICPETNKNTPELVFYLTDKAYGRLKSFAVTCGLSHEEMVNFEYDYILGKMVQIVITNGAENPKGGFYKEINQWFSLDHAMQGSNTTRHEPNQQATFQNPPTQQPTSTPAPAPMTAPGQQYQSQGYQPTQAPTPTPNYQQTATPPPGPTMVDPKEDLPF